MIGSGSASFELIRHLTERLPAMTTPRWVHNKIQPIAVDDALHYLVEAATAAVPSSRTWDIGGPDVLEYGDMMQVYAEVAGLRPRIMVVLPYLTPALASRWVRFVTPIRGKIARPLIESLECDAVAHEKDIDAVIHCAADYRIWVPDPEAMRAVNVEALKECSAYRMIDTRNASTTSGAASSPKAIHRKFCE